MDSASETSAMSDGKASIWSLLVCVLASTMAPLSIGITLAYSSPALPLMKKAGILNEESASIFASSMMLGALTGGLVAGKLVDILGRKTMMIIISVPYTLGWFGILWNYNLATLYAGRILTGIASGASSLVCPYMASTIREMALVYNFSNKVEADEMKFLS